MDPASAALALDRQLMATEWATTAAIAESHGRHLALLSAHAHLTSPAFRARLASAGLQSFDLAQPGGLQALPALTRRDLQACGDELFCATVPKGHGLVFETRTSGSTGEPVVIRRTGVSALFWQGMAMREMRWHRRDLSGRLCAIRAHVFAPRVAQDWGGPFCLFARTGPMLWLPITTDVPALAARVAAFEPALLVVYPSMLAALVRHCRQERVRFAGLRHVLTTGETLSPDVRQEAEFIFGASVADAYTSEEAGYLAVQCPESGQYHVMAESVIVEILDDRGEPCRPGEIGRVTVTDLHNYATPLVRYDIGDYAEAAMPCSCGRGLPTLTRIVGRQRNLIQTPDGRRYWPRLGFLRAREVAPIAQFQLVQDTMTTIDVRLVVERRLSSAEEDRLRALITGSLGYPFTLRFTYLTGRIPSGASGKYEEFVCRVA